MGLNLSGLKNFQEDLESRSGNSLFFNQKDIKEETDIRIMSPVPSLKGMYFFEQTVYWINKKPYISPATFGERCPMEAYIEQIELDAKLDKDLQALLDSNLFSKRSAFLIPILLLDCAFDAAGNATKIGVVDNAPKVLQAGPQLMKAINRIATSRTFQNGTEDGFTDRVKGFNMILTKRGKGLDTEYSAQGWRVPEEMDAKYYDQIPDVVELTRKSMKPKDYLIGVLNNYFYGDPMPEEPKEPAKTEETSRNTEEQKVETPVRTRASSNRTVTGGGATRSARPSVNTGTEEGTEDDPQESKAVARKARPVIGENEVKKQSSTGRNLVADLNNL